MQEICQKADTILGAGKPLEAAALYVEALRNTPHDARLWVNLGNALAAAGDRQRALNAYGHAVELCPDNAMMRFNYGSALLDGNDLDQARLHLEESARLQPDFFWTFERLGTLYHQLNDKSASLLSFDKALAMRPDDIGLVWRRCLAELSICYESELRLDEARLNYKNYLESLIKKFDPTIRHMLHTALDGIREPPFYLAYQGHNDVELQRHYGTFISNVLHAAHPAWCQSPTMPAPEPDGRWRIGFLSKYFAGHSVWKIPLRGWLEHLDRRRFRLFGYATDDARNSPAATLCDKFVHGDRPVEEIARIVAEDRLHALIFPEVGMDWKTICLAALKLAPLQLAGAGHPQTTGLDSIDLFLSSKMMEPPDAIQHYSEKLALLPNLSSCNYSPPYAETPPARETLGLPKKGILFFCPQSLFKYLPRFDDIYARIAEGVSDAKFLFIRHEISPGVTACFKDRLRKHFKQRGLDPVRHLVFLPRLSATGFGQICGASDIFLDSLEWSGNNTSLEAIWRGTPIVTMPGKMMRGRHAAANLTMAGQTATICANVEEYVKVAIDLANSPGKRKMLSMELRQNRAGAFGDLECVRGLEELLEMEIRSRIF
ncbi:Predicted O-linked N-acetylglucosamine transferase, SPINDLY family [Desulfonatronum zhilinae]|nr:Predicted O-linked N-acetylglucosamine transferase, SPINDLY family [Desulfonatronum zhilinae]